MSNDLISRAALQKVFEAECVGECGCCKHVKHDPEGCGLIDDAPSIDAEPVRHGRWILSGLNLQGNIRPKCSVCGKYHLTQWTDHIRCNYRPNCGAKMDAEE